MMHDDVGDLDTCGAHARGGGLDRRAVPPRRGRGRGGHQPRLRHRARAVALRRRRDLEPARRDGPAAHGRTRAHVGAGCSTTAAPCARRQGRLARGGRGHAPAPSRPRRRRSGPRIPTWRSRSATRPSTSTSWARPGARPSTPQRAVRIMEATLGLDHPKAAIPLTNYAELLNRLGRFEEAREPAERALAVFERETDPEGLYVTYPLMTLGLSHIGTGRFDEALAALERAARIREAKENVPAKLAEVHFALARALWGAGDELPDARGAGRARARASTSQAPATPATAARAGRDRPLARRPPRSWGLTPTARRFRALQRRNAPGGAVSATSSRTYFMSGAGPGLSPRLPRGNDPWAFSICSRRTGREQRAREKNIARAVNKYAQSPDRMKALQALRDDGSPEALYGLHAPLRHDVRQDDRGRAGEGVGLRDRWSRRAASILPAAQEVPARGGLDLLAAAPARQGRRRKEAGARRHRRRCSSATSPATSATRPRRSSSSTTWRRSSTRACRRWSSRTSSDMDEGVRYAAVEALLRQADEDVAREPLLELLRLRRRTACGSASGSPTASPSSAGRSGPTARRRREAAARRSSSIDARGADVRIKKKPEAKE